MNKLTNLAYRVSQNPLVSRAIHTFLQAFLAVLAVGGFKLDKVALTAAIAAGLSALKTFLVAYFAGRRA